MFHVDQNPSEDTQPTSLQVSEPNVPNPDKKIDKIVSEAIEDKEKEIKEANKELGNLKKQEKDGVYYSPIDTNPDSTLTYVAGAVFSILGDVVNGFREATEHIKNKVVTAQKTQNGGSSSEEAEKIIDQANDLLKMIGGATEKINAITGIGDGIKDDLSSLGETASGYASELFSKAKDVTVAGLKTGIQWYGNTLSNLIDMAMEMTGEKRILDTPIDKLSPDLNKKVILLAGVLQELSTNPATKQAVKEIAQAIAVTIVEILKEIQPQVNKVVDQATEMMEQVSEKLVTGATGTGVTVVQAFISEIPLVGGVINMMIAIAKAFNTLMLTFKVFVGKNSDMILTAAHTIKNTEDTALKGKQRVMGAIDNATNIIKQESQSSSAAAPSPSSASSAAPQTNTMKGGRGIDSTNIKPFVPIHYKIQKGGKRLRKTMKLFHKTLPKMKFSHLRKTSRNKPKGETKRAQYSKLSDNKKKSRKRK